MLAVEMGSSPGPCGWRDETFPARSEALGKPGHPGTLSPPTHRPSLGALSSGVHTQARVSSVPCHLLRGQEPLLRPWAHSLQLLRTAERGRAGRAGEGAARCECQKVLRTGLLGGDPCWQEHRPADYC